MTLNGDEVDESCRVVDGLIGMDMRPVGRERWVYLCGTCIAVAGIVCACCKRTSSSSGSRFLSNMCYVVYKSSIRRLVVL